MTDRNPHTGEKLQSKPNSNNFRDNFDKIFRASMEKKPLNNLKDIKKVLDDSSTHRW